MPMMGIQAITQSDDGQVVIPSSQDDWRDWVSATSTRNREIKGDRYIYRRSVGEERDGPFYIFHGRIAGSLKLANRVLIL